MIGIQSPLLAAVPHVSHRFFQRIGGTSPHPWHSLNTSIDVSDAPARVAENLARVRFQIGVPRDALFTCTQVHGRDVLVVHEDAAPEVIGARRADALVTHAEHLAVGVRTADCAPILLAVDDGSAVAAAHAGWRGAVGGVLAETVRALTELGRVPPARIVAAVGPCIGRDAFEVGAEVVAQAEAALGRALDEEIMRRAVDGKPHIDLGALVHALLAQAGVVRVERVGGCTFSDAGRYFSHRRDVTRDRLAETGRQMSAIARTEPPARADQS